MSAYTPYDICAWAGRQIVGGAKRKAVLNALALFADRLTWECWPSYATLAQYTEIAERSVSRAVSELERDGFIARTRIRRSDGSLAGWRFKLNPAAVETVIPGRPAATAEEAETAAAPPADDASAEDRDGAEIQPDLDDDYAAGTLHAPVANLAAGSQDAGERGRNGSPDVDFSQSPNQPGGETATVVEQASPPANGGGSLTTTGTTTKTPLPPSGAAARLPDGQAATPEHAKFEATTEADRFRQALLATFGDAVFRAWFDDLVVEDVDMGAGATPEVAVRLATGSMLRRDRLDQQHRPALERIWRAVNAPDAASVRIRVDVSALLVAAAAARREAQASPPPIPAGQERRRKRGTA